MTPPVRAPLLGLPELGPGELPRVGGKALGLWRLWDAGLPVPDTAVVPVSCFQAFLRDHHLEAAARRPPEPALARNIAAGALDPALAAALHHFAAGLDAPLAVRSSAVDEDGAGRSFAGQYHSEIGAAPGEGLLAAVRACWASFYAPEVAAYRREPPTLGGMAVVVQRLVRPKAAGVLFTINPLSGSWAEMTVEAVWGQGEALVAGRVVPDFYRVRRPRHLRGPLLRLARGRVREVERIVRPQDTQWQLAPGGGLEPTPVPAARQHRARLAPAELRRLCGLGLQAEAHIGGPQDVEWALDEAGRFTLLQARPVTAGADVRRAAPAVFTRRFVGERWTEPATPLGWSLMAEVLEWHISYPDTTRRLLGNEPATRLHRFAPYFNVTVFRHLAFKLPGLPPPRFMLEMLPPDEERGWLRRHAEAPDLRVYGSILAETARDRRWQRFRWNPLTNWRAWEGFERRLRAELPGLQGPLHGRGAARDRDRAATALARSYIGVHICSLLFANLWYPIAAGALEGDGRGDAVHRLLAAPAENQTVRTNAALWRLGRGELGLDAFLAEFGHRSSCSWELFAPRWAETPAAVRTLAERAAQGQRPGARAAEELDAEVAALRPRTRALVRLARRYLQLREDQRFWFDHLLCAWRSAWLWLEADLDLPLRFLEAGEARALLDGALSRARAEEAAARRQGAWEQERLRRQAGDEPPDFLVGGAPVDAELAGDQLFGMPISPGVATGTARVLRGPDEAGRLMPGDVLVARATDPGWTPLFGLASGVVLEMGSMLSHGAVLAREYGLPAVVNVVGATRRLPDGATVTVDGNRGVVWVR
jgi:rifampicin phosphotransferase